MTYRIGARVYVRTAGVSGVVVAVRASRLNYRHQIDFYTVLGDNGQTYHRFGAFLLPSIAPARPGNSVTHMAFGAVTWTFENPPAAPTLGGVWRDDRKKRLLKPHRLERGGE